jgi:WD40 repeat protein
LSAAFRPDGRRLATGEDDGSLRVWDLGTGRELHTLQGPGRKPAVCLAFSPDGTRLATGDPDGNVEVGDGAGGPNTIRLSGHLGSVIALSFSPDGARLASAGEDKTVRIWDVRGGKALRLLLGHADEVVSVSFGPDGKRIASAGADRTIKVWDTAKQPDPLTLFGGSSQTSAGFDEAGRPLVFAPPGRVLSWDPRDGLRTTNVNVGEARPAAGAVAPDGARFAVARPDGTIHVYDAKDGRELHVLPGHPEGGAANGRPHMLLAFGPAGRLASARDATVKVWGLSGDRAEWTLEGAEADGTIADLAFSGDGRLVAADTESGRVIVWDGTTGRELLRRALEPFRPDKAHRGLFAVVSVTSVQGVALGPDGRHLAWGQGNVVKLWDRDTGREPLTLIGHEKEVSGLAFSPDGKRLASCGQDRTVRLWDVGRGQEMLTLRDLAMAVRQVVFSPDGFRLAAAATDGTVKVWNATPRSPTRGDRNAPAQ